MCIDRGIFVYMYNNMCITICVYDRDAVHTSFRLPTVFILYILLTKPSQLIKIYIHIVTLNTPYV